MTFCHLPLHLLAYEGSVALNSKKASVHALKVYSFLLGRGPGPDHPAVQNLVPSLLVSGDLVLVPGLPGGVAVGLSLLEGEGKLYEYC